MTKKKKTTVRGGRRGFLKRLGIKKVVKKIAKEARRRGVMAARRAADYSVRAVPVVGNVYSVADFGIKARRAKKKGKLKSFLAKEGAMGIAGAIAPQAMAAYKSTKASNDIKRALIAGKGKARMIARRGTRNM